MIPLINKPNVWGSDSEYPYGSVKDRDGVVVGTPGSREVYDDMHQFFERLMALSNVTPNNFPDNDYNGFQLFEALVDRMKNTHSYGRFYSKVSQSGLSAPTVDDLRENDFGVSGVWSYVGPGDYRLTFPDPVLTSAAKVYSWATQTANGIIVVSFGSTTILSVKTYNTSFVASNGILDVDEIFVHNYPA